MLPFKICTTLKKKKNEGILTWGWVDIHITFSRIDLQMQIQLLSRESPLPGLQCSYRVAAWQRDLDKPPWKWEEKNKDSNSQRRSLPLRNCQLIHENVGGKTECQCCMHIQSQSSPAWTVNMHAHASTHRAHTEVPKNAHSIDWLLIENSWGGKKEVEQDLNADS